MRAGAFRRLYAVVLNCWVRSQAVCRAHRLAVVALLVAATGAVAVSLPAQAGQSAHKGSAAAAKARRGASPSRAVGPELVRLRSRFAQTYVGADGRRVARLYASPVHFKDRAGRWQRIDSRLRRVGDRLINRGNSYSVALDLREGNRYSYAGGDPVGHSDPMGLWSLSVGADLHFIGGGKVGGSIGSDGVSVGGGAGGGFGAGFDVKFSPKGGVGDSEAGVQTQPVQSSARRPVIAPATDISTRTPRLPMVRMSVQAPITMASSPSSGNGVR